MNGTTIAGYLYGEETYCPHCIYELFAGVDAADVPRQSTEDLLDQVARHRHIDRHNPRSSYQFPRPIYLADVTNGDYCISCGTPLAPPEMSRPAV